MKIKSIEFCSLIFILIESCIFGPIINGSFSLLGHNAWIVPIIGGILGFMVLLLYLYIYNYKDNMNINQLNIYLFGNVIGKIINTILIIIVALFTIIVFWILNNFIISQFLYNTPAFIIEFIFIITIIYVLHHGINALFRTVLILAYIIVVIYIINTLGLVRQVEIKNIMPFFDFKFTNLIIAVINYVAFAVFPIFIITIIPKSKIETNKLNKKIIITYIIGNVATSIILFLILSVFGINLSEIYQFPGYHILKRVFEGGSIERFENILVIFWLLIMFITVTIGSYYILRSLKDNFKIEKGKYIILIAILYSSHFIFKNSTVAVYWNEGIFPILMYISLLVVPLIIFLKIKKD